MLGHHAEHAHWGITTGVSHGRSEHSTPMVKGERANCVRFAATFAQKMNERGVNRTRFYVP